MCKMNFLNKQTHPILLILFIRALGAPNLFFTPGGDFHNGVFVVFSEITSWCVTVIAKLLLSLSMPKETK